MDNVNLCAQNDDNLEGILSTVKWSSNNNWMQFGPDKIFKINI